MVAVPVVSERDDNLCRSGALPQTPFQHCDLDGARTRDLRRDRAARYRLRYETKLTGEPGTLSSEPERPCRCIGRPQPTSALAAEVGAPA